jgi:hypothetical protein
MTRKEYILRKIKYSFLELGNAFKYTIGHLIIIPIILKFGLDGILFSCLIILFLILLFETRRIYRNFLVNKQRKLDRTIR